MLEKQLNTIKNQDQDKFFIADDNSLNSEKISDILQDYIDEGFVEIL